MYTAIASATSDNAQIAAASFRYGIHCSNTAADEESEFPMPITVVFQDEDTLSCARGLCERLITGFGVQSFRASEWWSPTLDVQTIYDLALTDAAQSNILMLALRSNESISARLSSLVTTWTGQRTRGGSALTALFVAAEDECPLVIPIDKYFREVAELKGLDYFSYSHRTKISPARATAPPCASAFSHPVAPVTSRASAFRERNTYHHGSRHE